MLTQFATNYEIIVVDDGSTDKTSAICQNIATHNQNVKLICHKKNLGIGMALRCGYQNARFEYVCAVPGDGQFNISELTQVRPFDNSIYYSFYRLETNYSWYRSILTWFNRFFNQHMLAIYLRDVNWIKVYRKEQLELVDPQLKSSLIESEICAKLYKLKILPIEIPSQYHLRAYGDSKGGNWNTLSKAALETIKLWWLVTFHKNKVQ